MSKQKTDNQMPDDEEIIYFLELESGWKASNKKPSETEILKMFPGSHDVISYNLESFKKCRKNLTRIIKKKLSIIAEITDDFGCWARREGLKANEINKLRIIDNHISRLTRMSNIVFNKPKRTGAITDEEIKSAVDRPLEDIVGHHIALRRSGKNLLGLCPFHQEQHPSFVINTEKNKWRCYGCDRFGNSVNFVRLINGFSFKEAVNFLNNK